MSYFTNKSIDTQILKNSSLLNVAGLYTYTHIPVSMYLIRGEGMVVMLHRSQDPWLIVGNIPPRCRWQISRLIVTSLKSHSSFQMSPRFKDQRHDGQSSYKAFLHKSLPPENRNTRKYLIWMDISRLWICWTACSF